MEMIADVLRSKASRMRRGGVLLDIGDDTAAWRTGSGVELATTDTMVQDVHFRLETTSCRDLGWKALAINLSDIAAMGGVPRYALVSLGLHPDTDVEEVAELYRGMKEIGDEIRVQGGWGRYGQGTVHDDKRVADWRDVGPRVLYAEGCGQGRRRDSGYGVPG